MCKLPIDIGHIIIEVYSYKTSIVWVVDMILPDNKGHPVRVACKPVHATNYGYGVMASIKHFEIKNLKKYSNTISFYKEEV